MNRINHIIVVCISFCFISLFQVDAQNFTPTTTWPYIYKGFQNALIYTATSNSPRSLKANIHLEHCVLHYLDSDKILEANPDNIIKVVVDEKTYIYINGGLVLLIDTKFGNSVVMRKKINIESLVAASNTGAYGMRSDVSASKKTSSIQISGIANMTHSQMKVEQDEGKELPLSIEYFFLLEDGYIIKATKRDVEKSLGEDGKTKLKAFVKQNKIKWKDEASLIKLLDFFQQ